MEPRAQPTPRARDRVATVANVERAVARLADGARVRAPARSQSRWRTAADLRAALHVHIANESTPSRLWRLWCRVDDLVLSPRYRTKRAKRRGPGMAHPREWRVFVFPPR